MPQELHVDERVDVQSNTVAQPHPSLHDAVQPPALLTSQLWGQVMTAAQGQQAAAGTHTFHGGTLVVMCTSRHGLVAFMYRMARFRPIGSHVQASTTCDDIHKGPEPKPQMLGRCKKAAWRCQ
jgi:hypothetical protein